MTECIRFFSSHSWAYSHRRSDLHSLLSPWIKGVDFEDYSLSRAHPLDTDTDSDLARELRDIIRRMDALLIMAGMYANNSPWMQFEIDMAFAFDVPIIPILGLGQERVPRLPTRLATVDPVRWRGASIREALLQCVSSQRRLALETQVAARLARSDASQNALAEARKAQASSSRNALADFLNPQPTPTSALDDLLRRLYGNKGSF